MWGFCSHIPAERCSLETALLSHINQGRIGDQDLLFEEPLRRTSLHPIVLEVTKGSVPTRLPLIRMPLDLYPPRSHRFGLSLDGFTTRYDRSSSLNLEGLRVPKAQLSFGGTCMRRDLSSICLRLEKFFGEVKYIAVGPQPAIAYKNRLSAFEMLAIAARISFPMAIF